MRKLLAFVSLSLCLAACVEPARPEPVAPTAAPGDEPPSGPVAACAGRVDVAPAGLVAVDETPPLFALGQPGKGALCEGQVFAAKEPVTVYRVFSASYETSKRAGPTGAYWTLQKPSGKKAEYCASYCICSEWNDLDMLNECKLEIGAKVVLGPGQSATCNDGKVYSASSTNQVLILKKPDGKVPVTDCTQSNVTWAL